MGLFDWLKPPPAIDAATSAAIEQAVAAIEPKIRLVGGYRTRLAPAVREALAYCTDVAARVPGPIEISRSSFAADPFVHALFGSVDDIETMLASSDCLRDPQLPLLPEDDRYCALLGMRRHEKAGFGAALQGDIVRLDVPQRTLYFSDHTLAEPSTNLDAARQRLRAALFAGLLKTFAAHVAEVRAEQMRLSMLRSLGHVQERAAHEAHANGPPDDLPAHVRRLDALGRRLRADAGALRPEALLDTLTACLAVPEDFLRIDPVAVSVDHNGVIASTHDGATAAGSADSATALNFMELTARDQRRWVVILAHIRREDIRHASERLAAARRHIVI